MDYDFKVNEKFPIGKLGKRFKIIGKKNIDGFIDFTDGLGHCYSQGLRKYDYCDFNIEEMRKDGILTFDPCFVEFITEDNIETINIILPPVNPDAEER
jgi:hypothetical protein